MLKLIKRVTVGPEKMITIPPRNYCIIENPIIRNKEGRVNIDENGQAKLDFADLEIRFNQEPFPLYPGETLKQVI
jgi:major vault protein